MKNVLLLIFALLCYGVLSAQETQDLEWWIQYERPDDAGVLHRAPATVPGAVQLDVALAEGYGPYYYAENWKDYLWTGRYGCLAGGWVWDLHLV